MLREKKENMEKKEVSKRDYVFAVGRRKEAVGRVRLYANARAPVVWGDQEVKKGEIFVNKIPASSYFYGDSAKIEYMRPFKITNFDKFIVTAKVEGGGKKGQLQALVMGISRALNLLNREKFRPLLKKNGLLTRDPRIRERRKVGTGGKARRKKQSPKR